MSTTPLIPPADPRTYNQRLLDQIRALLLGKALDDVASYKIGNNRELVKMPLPDLRRWEAEIEARVRNEQRKALGLPRRRAAVIFGAAEELKASEVLSFLARLETEIPPPVGQHHSFTYSEFGSDEAGWMPWLCLSIRYHSGHQNFLVDDADLADVDALIAEIKLGIEGR